MKIKICILGCIAVFTGAALLQMPVLADNAVGQEAKLVRTVKQETTTIYYNTLEEALEQANSVNGDTVYLEKSADISGEVTVKQGVTLVLPAAGKGYEKDGYNPKNEGTVIAPSLETSLLIPKDASLIVEGQVLVNAVTGVAREDEANGYDVSGPYSQIDLNGRILVQRGGILDVYGYVEGTGQVTAENGGTVRDTMVIRHWRGMNYATVLAAFNSIFPFNEYDMHHIRTDIRINSGGVLGGNLRIYGNGKYYTKSFLMVDGQNGICRLKDGAYLIRSYDRGTDREYWDLYGGALFANAEYNVSGNTLNTKNYFFPLDGRQSFRLHAGDYAFQYLYKFMPGSELTVDQDSSMTIAQGGRMVFYGSDFRDAYTANQTGYPTGRTGARLDLNGRLIVNGAIGGEVRTGPASIITYGNKAQKTVDLPETGDRGTVMNEVKLRVLGAVTFILPDSIRLNQSSLNLVPGSSVTLKVSFQPASATQKSLNWSSSNTKVAAVDRSGNVKALSPGTAVVKAVTENGKTASCTVSVAYGAPKSVKAKLLSNYTVKLTWTKAANAKKYGIYRSASKNGKYKEISSVKGQSYNDKKAKAGNTYYYKIKANGVYSPAVGIKLAPKAPANMKASSKKGKVQLRWKKVSGAGGYQVFRSVSKNGRFKKVTEVKSGSWTDKKVKKKKTYYYKVKTWKKIKGKTVCSSYSKAVKVKAK